MAARLMYREWLVLPEVLLIKAATEIKAIVRISIAMITSSKVKPCESFDLWRNTDVSIAAGHCDSFRNSVVRERNVMPLPPHLGTGFTTPAQDGILVWCLPPSEPNRGTLLANIRKCTGIRIGALCR